MKYINSILFCFICLLLFTYHNDKHDEVLTKPSPKYNNKVTTEEKFANDRIVVILDEEHSKSYKDYTEKDFENINAKSVTDLSSTATSEFRSKSIYKNDKVNLDNYKRILLVELNNSSKEYVLECVETISERDDVYYCEPDFVLEMEDDNTDALPPENLIDWGLDAINIRDVWKYTTGSKEVSVGVLDTGIDSTHPDLQDNLNVSKSRDCTDLIENQIISINDWKGHGTHVAGIIGASWDNENVYGVCKNVELISLQIQKQNTRDEEHIFNTFAVKGINYAQSIGIDILNMSFGDYVDESEYSSLYQEIQNYNGLFVCSAGNDEGFGPQNIDQTPRYPSNFNLDNIICVGALDQDGDRRDNSNYGVNNVDIYAPGGNIYSTYPWQTNRQVHYDYYETLSGTSMAAPFVTGVAALLLSINHNLTVSQLKTAILAGADYITITTPGGNQNVKKLNALGALIKCLTIYSTNTHYLDYENILENGYNFSLSTNIDSEYLIENEGFMYFIIEVDQWDYYNFYITSTSSFDIILYNHVLQEIEIYVSASGNTKMFTTLLDDNCSYVLRLIPSSSTTFNINISTHSHLYNIISPATNTTHLAECACGAYRYDMHTVDPKTIGKPIKTCLFCGSIINSDIIGGNFTNEHENDCEHS